jgi:adenosylcobyric acid synthase
MMGMSVSDPYGVEGEPRTVDALGLLPVHTVLEKEKTTLRRRFRFRQQPQWCNGYEIHMGQTVINESAALNCLEDGSPEGYLLSDRCWGTYMHGILDNATVVESLLAVYGKEHQTPLDHTGFKEQQYDLLANHIRQHVDLPFIYNSLQQ